MTDQEILGAAMAYTDAHGGGGGGTTNYNNLDNLPQIGGVTLQGNKTADDLGLVAAETGKGLSANNYTDEDKAIVGGVTAALADKQNELTAGSHITIDNDEISVQRWAVPAGKVVYTVITSDENYGQNVHVQRHTLGGTFIDDRVYFVQTWQTATVDDVISIKDTYGKFEITLLKNSDEQSAGYKYIVQPVTTPTSNSFTFLMEQEENGNDLIIRSELDTKQDKLTFDDTPTDNSNNPVKSNGIYDALALKQDKTDNSLQTTDKTVVGAVNELKSGLTNYENQNDFNLEVPDRVNLFDKDNIDSINKYYDGARWIYQSVGSWKTIFVPVVAGCTYTSSGFPNNSGVASVFVKSDKSTVLLAFDSSNNNRTFVVPDMAEYVGFGIWSPDEDYTSAQLELGSTATAYAPYIPSVDARLDAVESGLTNVETRVYGDYHTIQAGSSVDIPITEGVYRFITCRDSNRFLTCGLITYNWSGTPDVTLLYSSDNSLITVTASAGKVTFTNAAQSSYCNLILYKIF